MFEGIHLIQINSDPHQMAIKRLGPCSKRRKKRMEVFLGTQLILTFTYFYLYIFIFESSKLDQWMPVDKYPVLPSTDVFAIPKSTRFRHAAVRVTAQVKNGDRRRGVLLWDHAKIEDPILAKQKTVELRFSYGFSKHLPISQRIYKENQKIVQVFTSASSIAQKRVQQPLELNKASSRGCRTKLLLLPEVVSDSQYFLKASHILQNKNV